MTTNDENQVVLNRSELALVRRALVSDHNRKMRAANRGTSKQRPSVLAIELATLKRVILRIDAANRADALAGRDEQ
jgi:hypothetical protein